jgi:hypothetical protein
MLQKTIFNFCICVSIFVVSCSPVKQTATEGLLPYNPASKELHDSILHLDKIFFDAYNNCQLNVFEDLISEDIEFYHDQGGLSTSKKDLIESLKNNICNKVTRELLTGSIEVYPIPGYGAVQMGAHRFHNKAEPGAESRYAKFVHTWKNENGKWRITRVISLHK